MWIYPRKCLWVTLVTTSQRRSTTTEVDKGGKRRSVTRSPRHRSWGKKERSEREDSEESKSAGKEHRQPFYFHERATAWHFIHQRLWKKGDEKTKKKKVTIVLRVYRRIIRTFPGQANRIAAGKRGVRKGTKSGIFRFSIQDGLNEWGADCLQERGTGRKGSPEQLGKTELKDKSL